LPAAKITVFVILLPFNWKKSEAKKTLNTINAKVNRSLRR